MCREAKMLDKPMTVAQMRQELNVLARILGADRKYAGLRLPQLFQYLRLAARYTKFDLEATRRELRYCQEHRER